MTETYIQGLITVIVPVYNVEQYIDKCLRSLLDQTYKEIEIIVVDDGSTDRSGIICDRYSDEVKVIHKNNGGQGSARNIGLDLATGEFICFVDSDDSVMPDYIEFLYQQLIKKKIDISVCNNRMIGEDGDYLRDRVIGNGYVEMSGIQAIQSMWSNGVINIAPWGKLFKRELWKSIRFAECFSEDWAIMHLVYERAKKVGFSFETKLNYLVRKTSSIRNFQEKKLDMLKVAEDNISFANQYPELLPAARQKAVSVYFHVLFQLPDDKKYDAIKKEIKKKIKGLRISVLTDKNCTRKTKYGLLFSYLGFGCAKHILRIIKRKDITF